MASECGFSQSNVSTSLLPRTCTSVQGTKVVDTWEVNLLTLPKWEVKLLTPGAKSGTRLEVKLFTTARGLEVKLMTLSTFAGIRQCTSDGCRRQIDGVLLQRRQQSSRRHLLHGIARWPMGLDRLPKATQGLHRRRKIQPALGLRNLTHARHSSRVVVIITVDASSSTIAP